MKWCTAFFLLLGLCDGRRRRNRISFESIGHEILKQYNQVEYFLSAVEEYQNSGQFTYEIDQFLTVKLQNKNNQEFELDVKWWNADVLNGKVQYARYFWYAPFTRKLPIQSTPLFFDPLFDFFG